MSSNLLPTILVTGLTTALVVLGYQHLTTTRSLSAEIKTQQEAIGRLNVEIMSPSSVKEETHPSETEIVVATSESKVDEGNHPSGVGDQWIYGNARARFTLMELTDTECPYCRDHFPVLKALIESSGGNINGAILHVPVQGEPSRRQAVAVECAGEQGGSEAAWKMMDTILHATRGSGQGILKPTAVMAGEMALDQQRFIACTESVEVIDRITSDLDVALKLGVAQTPSTLVYDNTTGQSILLQGSHASGEGIVEAIEKLTLNQGG